MFAVSGAEPRGEMFLLCIEGALKHKEAAAQWAGGKNSATSTFPHGLVQGERPSKGVGAVNEGIYTINYSV